MKAGKALPLSDAEVSAAADQACTYMDKDNQVVAGNDPYAQRLAKITQGLANEDGLNLNFKVYRTADVNAWAMANGCIRVYSGLMDMMTDDEVLGVVGHEIGHVALGHSKKAMQTAYTVSAARDAAGAAGGATVAALNSSQLGDLTENCRPRSSIPVVW
ncbi:hypothetical protein G6F50_016390 [Rhizopus delemar]|uniref:Peptidase M48 domain-containing protein n=1 Tax=Rhizopus delemar TaxID=936053 RepID=A0A9P7C2B9_9FUNG|nr:hypothetical protein G6F50_016390 [Rhizopus delemar]